MRKYMKYVKRTAASDLASWEFTSGSSSVVETILSHPNSIDGSLFTNESQTELLIGSGLLGISKPVAKRAIAPTGTIGILAGTTTGVEPLFAVAYKRRYLKGTRWHYQTVVDGAAQEMINFTESIPRRLSRLLISLKTSKSVLNFKRTSKIMLIKVSQALLIFLLGALAS
jgi:hypothetical protein